MYNVSSEYRLHIKDQVRGASHMRVTLGIEAVGASETVTTEPIEGVGIYSELEKVHRGQPVEQVYHSMEHNRFVLDGRGLLPPDPGQPISYYQGYVSEDISSSAGLFSAENPPGITVDFTDPIILRGLTFRFDALMNCYPTSMEINGYFESSLVYSETVSPDATQWVLEDDIPATGYIDSLEILFLSTSPARRRAMLSYLYFGIVKVFTDNQIVQATWYRDIDLISTKLPKESFTFTILDLMREYDPENPVGVWKYLDERQPVQFEYGYEVKRPRSTWGDLLGTTWGDLLDTTWGNLYNDTYDIEWMPGGQMYTNGDIKFESEHRIPHVTFQAVTYGSQLSDIYYKGVYSPDFGGRSFYNLANAVFTEANMPNLPGDVTPYYVDPDLMYIKTMLPIPEVPIKEALQLIANATQSVLWTDRQGVLRLERIFSRSRPEARGMLPAGRMIADVYYDGFAATPSDWYAVRDLVVALTGAVTPESPLNVKAADVDADGYITGGDMDAIMEIMDAAGGFLDSKARTPYTRDLIGFWTAREDLTTTAKLYDDYVYYYDVAVSYVEEGKVYRVYGRPVPPTTQEYVDSLGIYEYGIGVIDPEASITTRIRVFIKRLPTVDVLFRVDPVDSFVLDLSSCYEAPKVEKIPLLKSVSTGWSTISVASSSTLLTEVSVAYSENTEIRISHEEAYQTSIAVSGVTVIGTPVLGARSAILTVIGTGTIQVSGKLITRNLSSLEHTVSPVGYSCPVTNPLIDKREDAQAYAEWIAVVLQRRTGYEVPNRGFPELDITDLIEAETLQTPSLTAAITMSEITYDGTLSGRTKYYIEEVEY